MPQELNGAVGSAGPERGARSGLSPWIGFGIGVLLLAASGLWFMSQPNSELVTVEPTAQASEMELTHADAIERLKELSALRLEAFRKLDRSLISEIAVGGSPFAKRVFSEMRQFIADGVYPRPNFKTLDIDVITSANDEIVLREVVLARTKFVDAVGRDVTTKEQPQRQIVRWVMRFDGTKWLLYDSLISKGQSLEGKKK